MHAGIWKNTREVPEARREAECFCHFSSRHWAVVFNKIRVKRRPEMEMGEGLQKQCFTRSCCLLVYFAKVSARRETSPKVQIVILWCVYCWDLYTFVFMLCGKLTARIFVAGFLFACRTQSVAVLAAVRWRGTGAGSWAAPHSAATSGVALSPVRPVRVASVHSWKKNKSGVGKQNLGVWYHFSQADTWRRKIGHDTGAITVRIRSSLVAREHHVQATRKN